MKADVAQKQFTTTESRVILSLKPTHFQNTK